ncbi:MAG: aminoacyl-tRNA hydrolase [Parcubacteria group bacterium]|jgi:PTH1 family peptidyl-tRNA hydrolase
MKLIIGLGNPGKQYENTRHNVGFMMVDRIKEKYDFPDFTLNKKFNSEISERLLDSKFKIQNSKFLLLKPQTFMNNSGDSVRTILDFYKLSPEDIIVIHDDIDLPLGEYKIATQSGSAGHNGVEDIITKLGTKEFQRIRIGIATENLRSQIEPADFVLQNFSGEELEKIEEMYSGVLKEIEKLI